ncbi:hypothetical protein FRC18_009026 [Serendipita sp. 400]|nr:hypothetical protein FRC18_009026 [Serendipita sp. 400]
MNGRSLYKWLFDIRKRRKVPIHHVKSHTKSRDTASLLNEKADKAAEHAMKYGAMILPEPTFQMDKFMLYSPIDSYIEGNIQRFISHMLAQAEAEAIGAGGNIRMAERLFQNFDPPKSTYIRSPSGYSVSVQLLARSGQLDTMFRRWKRNMKQDNEGRCEFGCQSLQDDHHIFVECPNFQHMRDETKAVLKRVTKSEGEKRGMDAGALAPFISRAESLVTDGDVWPFSESLYYVGRIPDMSTLRADQNGHKDWEWKTRISTVWHVECIKLAGRIWGTVMRDRDKRWWDGKNPRGVA